MAIKLENKVNTEAPNAAYPFGNIKNNTGSNNGTPVDKNVYADFHQFFAKMMNESGIAYNDLPDNNTDGFQYWLALVEAVKNNCGLYEDISSTITINAAISGGTLIARRYFNGTIIISYITGFTSNIPQDTNLLSGIPNAAPQVFQLITASGGNRAVNNLYVIGTNIINYFSIISTLGGGTGGGTSFTFYLEYKEI